MTTNTGDWNTGDWNTGYRNTGHYNTGHRNTGRRNTGHYNTGRRNTGHYNTGRRNTGHYNTGHRNTGRRNTGYCNTGDWNTGDWNSASYHVGCFNTIDAETAYFFNKPLKINVWNEAYIPDWLRLPEPTAWVLSENMTEEEKKNNPSHKTTGGYLRANSMKDEWRKAYESASECDIQAVRDLPNFDYDVFEEITGLDLRVSSVEPPKEIVVDGVTYVQKTV